MHAAAAHALDDGGVGHVDLEHDVELDAGGFIASACGMVRGKPSNRKPLAQSGCVMRSFTRPMMMSSLTRPPESITRLAAMPSGGAGLHRGAQHVAGGDLRDAVLLGR